MPEDIRWIPATTQGRVERIVLWPGTAVTPTSVILELTNPQLDQEAEEAQLKLQSAEATLANVRVQLQNDLLQQKAAAASIEAEYQKAQMQAEMNAALARDQLVSDLVRRQSVLEADQLAVRRDIGQEQLATQAETSRAQLAVQQSDGRPGACLPGAQDAATRRAPRASRARRNAAGGAGGGRAAGRPGHQPGAGRESGAAEGGNPDCGNAGQGPAAGQRASIDTRNGVIAGRVMRIDPSVQNGTRTVDVALEGTLPNGAVPDLSVDGTIELERLPDVLYVGRPAFGQDQSTVGLFKVDPATQVATRVPVTLGRSSVSTIEVVAGLQAGDRVILSDMSAWDGVERVQLR